MRRLQLYFFLLIFFVSPLFAVAAEDTVKVTLSFDKRSVELNEEVRMVIRVEGGQGAIERPRIPQITGFNTYYLGRTSELTIVNGQKSTLTEFAFSLVPMAAGKYKVPPVSVEVGSSLYRTPPSEIEVLGINGQISQGPTAPASLPQAPARMTGPAPLFTPSQAPASRNIQSPPPVTFAPSEGGSEIFAKAWTDRPSVYVGEQVTLTYSIYYRTDASLEGFDQEPVTTGFWTEDIPVNPNLEKKNVRVGGLTYLTSDFRRVALFPTREGTFQIDPGVIKATIIERPRTSGNFVDDFFNDNFFQSGGLFAKKVPRLLRVNPVSLTVLPLPETGKPESFNGAVGDLSFRADIDKKSVRQNEPVVLTMTLQGAGNIETVNKPVIPEIAGVKAYDSDSDLQVSPRGNIIGGQKTFEVTFLPSQIGTLTIPSVEFSFFNPRTRSYQVHKTEDFRIEVTKGTGAVSHPIPEEVRSPGKKKVIPGTDDIQYIRQDLSPGLGVRYEGPIHRVMAGAAILLTLIFLFLRYHFRKEEFYAKNAGLKRLLRAERQAEKGIRRLQRLGKARGEEKFRQFFAEAHQVMSGYLADKFNISAQGLTLTEIEAQLTHFQIVENLYEKIRTFYEITDRARFAPNLLSASDLGELIVTLKETIRALSRKIK